MNTAQRFEKAYAVALMSTDAKFRAQLQTRFGAIRGQTDHAMEQAIVQINKLLGRDHSNSACDENISLFDFVHFNAVKVPNNREGFRRGVIYWVEETREFYRINVLGTKFRISEGCAKNDEHLAMWLQSLDFATPVKSINFMKFAGL